MKILLFMYLWGWLAINILRMETFLAPPNSKEFFKVLDNFGQKSLETSDLRFFVTPAYKFHQPLFWTEQHP